MILKERIKNYIRVLTITRKPDREEFVSTLRIVLIGIGVVGFIGFLFYLFSVIFLGGL